MRRTVLSHLSDEELLREVGGAAAKDRAGHNGGRRLPGEKNAG